MSLAWRFAQFMGVITGALSLFSLCRQVLNFGLAEPMRQIFDYYQKILGALLGWADAPLHNLIAYIQSLTGLSLHLDPNWKHIFVLMWLYFSLDARTNWKDRKRFGVFGISIGLLIALLAVLIMTIDEERGIIGSSAPMVGIFIWETTRNIWSSVFHISTSSFDAKNKHWLDIFIFRFTRYALPTLVITIFVIFVNALITRAGDARSPSDIRSLSLLLFVAAMGLYWNARGIYLGVFDRRPDEKLTERIKRSSSAYFGRLILSTILGMVAFLVLNAGLQSLGL